MSFWPILRVVVAVRPELAEVRASRVHRLASHNRESTPTGPELGTQHETKSPPQEAHSLNLFGLAFSGGGIRSATFNLGILQALAEMRNLSSIDYLSTVSGGGYIGCWFLAWCKRLGAPA